MNKFQVVYLWAIILAWFAVIAYAEFFRTDKQRAEATLSEFPLVEFEEDVIERLRRIEAYIIFGDCCNKKGEE